MKSRLIKRGTAAAAALVMSASAAAVMPAAAADSFLVQMGAGWNLGNTFDATGGSGVDSETSWGNPKTTQEMIDTVHNAGFETLRIPVSWGKHVDSNYIVDSAWMARVKEVVDYAYKDGMHVILNIHHDNLSSGQNGIGFYPDSEHKAESLKFLTTVWQQIAEEFKDYDENLIFETLNEPRLAGTNYEWQSPQWDNSATMTDSCNVINEFNQEIVNTIRSGSGYNKSRYIMAPGYAASVGSAAADIYKLPTDPISGNSGKILVSTHAYTPYDLCLGSSTDITSSRYTQFTASGKKELDNMFASLDEKFTSKGIGVVMGEMGISNKNNNDARTAWASYYYSLGKEYGIPCVLWDNNAKNGSTKSENHWHLNRKTLKWGDPDVIQAIMDAVGVSNAVIPPDDDVVSKSDQTVTIDKVSAKTFGDAAFNIVAKASDGGELSYESSNTSVLTVGSTGKVNINGAGTAVITVTANETAKYKSGSASIEITVAPKAITPTVAAISDQQYTGSEIKPTVSVKDGSKVISSVNYTVEYSDNVVPGTATAKVTMKGNYSGTAAVTFNIIGTLDSDSSSVPHKDSNTDTNNKAPSKVKLASYSSNTSKIKLKWNKADNADGYRVYRYNSTSKKYVKVATVSANRLYYLDSGLNPATAYKYKVRAYRKENGKAVWGEPSSAAVTLTKPNQVVCTRASKSKTAIKLTWKSVKCSGYELYTYDNNAKDWVLVNKYSSKTTSATVRSLKSKTTYKFKIRAYVKTSSGKVKYGSWSKNYVIKTK